MARAMWKATLRLAKVEIPVKLYAAVRERGVHFRLLHAKDRTPVRQRMVDAESGEEVPAEEIRRGLRIDEGTYAVVDPEELRVAAAEDRTIEVSRFVPRDSIDLGWYARPYYLGPDRSAPDYFALAEAIGAGTRAGVAHWSMRGRSHHGVLDARDGYLVLTSLHAAEEVVPMSAVAPPETQSISAGERKLGEQLVATLDAPFDPTVLRDEYRERVLALVEKKAKGKKYRVEEAPRPRAVTDLTRALERSLKQAEKRVA
jgi:DNA end-binding protein Ku